MLDILKSVFTPDIQRDLLILVVTFLSLFLKSFLDYLKPGKSDNIVHNGILWVIRTIINKISPEELGRSAANKINPTNPDSRRISKNKEFTKEDGKKLNAAIEKARGSSFIAKKITKEPKPKPASIDDVWDF